MSDAPSILLGQLAVARGLVTQADVDLCLRAHAQLGGRYPLGALFVHRSLITEAQLQELLALQKESMQAGRPKPAPTGAPAASPRSSASPRPVRDAAPAARPLEQGAPAAARATAARAPSAPTAPPPSRPAAEDAPSTPRPAAERAAPPPRALEPTAAGASAGSPERAQPISAQGPMRLLSALDMAEKRGASDVHFHPGTPLSLRANGRLLVGGNAPLEARALAAQLRELLTPQEQAQLAAELSLDVLLTTPSGLRARGNIYLTHLGTHATFRLVRRLPPLLPELGLPPQIASFVKCAQGMVLVTGLSGSGKSSTLAALVNLIAQERAEHILCLEDPVEILHPSQLALVNQRQVGRDSSSFARALRGALREDPDVIVIGDLRDKETISLAVTAAETGHLVLASMNTATAVRAITRIVSAFPPAQQPQVRSMVSESLHGVITQRLMPTLDGGRALALEILMVTPAIANLIRDDKMVQVRSAMQTGRAAGMRTMDDSLRELVFSGRVSPDDARRVAENPALMELPLGASVPGPRDVVSGQGVARSSAPPPAISRPGGLKGQG